MSVEIRFRDILKRYLPPWLMERLQAGKTVAYRFLWSLVAPLDAAADTLLQGFVARFPGVGTPTALPLTSRSRGIIRNEDESDEDWAKRLIAWLDTWDDVGWEERTAMAVHEYLATKPRVRVISRDGAWTTIDEDGTVTRTDAPWDWDSVTHPERNDPDEPWWSDLFMVVYTTDQWPLRGGTFGDLADLPGDDGYAIGHMVPTKHVDAVMSLFATWKAAHSRYRAVIWTTDETLFDPSDPDTCPDGTWGAWGMYVGGSFVLGGRNLTTCRYWEPR